MSIGDDSSLGSHRNSGVDPGRAAGYVYARGGAGWQKPGRLGVLPTRLSAVDEAATLDFFARIKRDTNSQRTNPNRRPSGAGLDDARLLAMAAWRVPMADRTRGYRDPCCCHESKRGNPSKVTYKLTKFVPFDPCNKDLRSDSGGYGRRHAARRERGICGGDQD